MENRDSIVRKLNALKAMFEHGNTSEAEVISAMEKYNELMQKYNMTETDLHIKQSGIHKNTVNSNSLIRNAMYYMVVPITWVSDTKVICFTKDAELRYMFVGTKADTDYAEFLYRLLDGSVKSAWKAYKASPAYINLKKHHHGAMLKKAFEMGFITRIAEKLEAMTEKNKGTGTSLMVIKNALIEAFLNDEGMKASTTKEVSTIVKSDAASYAGYAEGDKVRLRQEAEAQTKYLEAK